MTQYTKLAGTSAVFIQRIEGNSAPDERGGFVWSAHELHADKIPHALQRKPAMANSLALEGLEEYMSASHGDVRRVKSLMSDFIYIQEIRGWVQYFEQLLQPS